MAVIEIDPIISLFDSLLMHIKDVTPTIMIFYTIATNIHTPTAIDATTTYTMLHHNKNYYHYIIIIIIIIIITITITITITIINIKHEE